MSELPRRAFVAQIMGLPISIHLRGPLARQDGPAELVEAAYDRLRADEAIFSKFRPDSPISRIRDGRDRLQDASSRIRQVVGLCELAGQRTGGAFSAWLPGPDGRPAFDPTGLVKGWAVEASFNQLVDELNAFGAHDAMINAGGDIQLCCSRTDTPAWLIGIEDPRDRSRMLRTLELRTGAVATSGTAARGDHITDPQTGAAATSLLSATIIGPSLTWADVYATAAMVKGPAASGWIATIPDHLGFLVSPTGRLTTVEGGQL